MSTLGRSLRNNFATSGRRSADADARKALERLDKSGFRISHLTPRDASLNHPSWADYIAALPLLPNEPTTRRIHRESDFRKHLPLARELRTLAETLNSPFVDLTIFGTRDLADFPNNLQEDLLKTASTLEHFLSWNYCVRYINPQISS